MEDSLEARRLLDQALHSVEDGQAENMAVGREARDHLLTTLKNVTLKNSDEGVLLGLDVDRLPSDFVQAELWRAVRAAGRPAVETARKIVDQDDKVKRTQKAKFDAWYMENATLALGNELDRLRQDAAFTGSEDDVKLLIESLHVGAHDAIFDADMKALLCTK